MSKKINNRPSSNTKRAKKNSGNLAGILIISAVGIVFSAII